MAISVLMVYQPIESTGEMESYWRSYINFYEKYWDGPATPQSSWYGKEYEDFRSSLSGELGLGADEIRDCFFIKDKEGKHFLAPITKEVNLNIFSAENFIPYEWLLMYIGDEKKYFYTHTGFGAVHQDAIYYNTRVKDAQDRLKESISDLDDALSELGEKSAYPTLSEILSATNEGVENLLGWLNGFDGTGFVLLNYGELCAHIVQDTLKNEDSVTEIRQAIELAADGDYEASESALRVLESKWEEIRAAAMGSQASSTSTVQ